MSEEEGEGEEFTSIFPQLARKKKGRKEKGAG